MSGEERRPELTVIFLLKLSHIENLYIHSGSLGTGTDGLINKGKKVVQENQATSTL